MSRSRFSGCGPIGAGNKRYKAVLQNGWPIFNLLLSGYLCTIMAHFNLVKRLSIVGVVFYFGMASSCQSPQITDDYETTIIKIIDAFRRQDDSTVNSLISKEVGLAVIYRTGVFDVYTIIDSIHFEQPVPTYFPYPQDMPIADSLDHGDLPSFDCGDMLWNKTGLFSDTTQRDNRLLQTAQNLINYRGDSISVTDIRRFQEIGQHSRRVILASNTTESLIFNLIRINNRWYLALIDRVTTDCSA